MEINKFWLLLLPAFALLAAFWEKPAPTNLGHEQPSKLQHLPDPENPVELGKVHWQRDYQSAQMAAQKSGKPLLILFQEVPGCSNCTRYGKLQLSHPLVVEAIESFFVPLCIYNNKGGKDAETLRQFNEPAWNNPVVRIVRADGTDIVPRVGDFVSMARLIGSMRDALDVLGQAPPPYLHLLAEEWAARERGLETATFTMYCFWSGEGLLGSIPGVVSSEPGFQDGREVVQVQFSPAITSRQALEEKVKPEGITLSQKNEGFKPDREPKYYLSKTDYRYVPMTSLQACRANSLVGKGQSPETVLSPRQLGLLEDIRKKPASERKNRIGQKLTSDD